VRPDARSGRFPKLIRNRLSVPPTLRDDILHKTSVFRGGFFVFRTFHFQNIESWLKKFLLG
jgi:hypothetical protein